MFVESTILALIFGSFAYTRSTTSKQATKEDVQDLRDRVNTLYEHLLKTPMPEPTKHDKGAR